METIQNKITNCETITWQELKTYEFNTLKEEQGRDVTKLKHSIVMDGFDDAFDHEKFWQWVVDKSKTHKIYVSEYQAPQDFKKVLEFSQKSTLQGGSQKHDNQANECLFTIQ